MRSDKNLSYYLRIAEIISKGEPFVIVTPNGMFKYTAQKKDKREGGKKISITIIDEEVVSR